MGGIALLEPVPAGAPGFSGLGLDALLKVITDAQSVAELDFAPTSQIGMPVSASDLSMSPFLRDVR
jgi:hypothetical protein